MLMLAFLSWYGIGCGTDEVRQRQAASPTLIRSQSLTDGGGAAQKTTTTAISWHYPNPGVPENWASLSDEFRTCAESVEQSPVNPNPPMGCGHGGWSRDGRAGNETTGT